MLGQNILTRERLGMFSGRRLNVFAWSGQLKGVRFERRNGVDSSHEQPHRNYPQVVEDREEALTAPTLHKSRVF